METEARFEDGRLIVTRTYAADRALVFEAWVETSRLSQWWGCKECVAVRSEVEPRVGGKYNHHMTIEGVGDVPGFATLTEFEPPRRLAYETALPGDPSVRMTVEVTFAEVEDGTKVTLIQTGIPDTSVDGDMPLREIIRDGWSAAFSKLNRLFQSAAGVADE